MEGRTLKDDLERLLPERSTIIEAGCGLGAWVHLLRSEGHEVCGVDFEEETVRRVNADDPTLQVTVGNVTQLDFADGHFDAYISLGVVEHFREGPKAALDEALRVLKPGGLAFVTVPMLNALRRAVSHPMCDFYFAIQTRRGKVTPTFWEYRYLIDEMTTFLRNSGFEIVETGVDDYRPEFEDCHIGPHAGFFFLREKGAVGYRLNRAGRAMKRLVRSMLAATSTGILVVARKPVRAKSS